MRRAALALLVLALAHVPACRSAEPEAGLPSGAARADPPGTPSRIFVAGIPFPTAARVITWKDPGGYDGYRERCFFDPGRVLPERPGRGTNQARRYDLRSASELPPASQAEVRILGHDLETLRQQVDQFVIHYDVCLTSRQCFKVLHDLRGLSVHFLLDLDGTVYQTLDLAERARHATRANDRSIGIEIAQIGAYGSVEEVDRWYRVDGGDVRLVLRDDLAAGLATPGFVARPFRPGIFDAVINGRRVHQRDFTEAQYAALAELLRTLVTALPRIELTVPREPSGAVLDRVLTAEEFDRYSGLLGHWHVQSNKVDPGPAFDWKRLLAAARAQD